MKETAEDPAVVSQGDDGAPPRDKGRDGRCAERADRRGIKI